MRIKLHLMGALKEKRDFQHYLDHNYQLEINEQTTPQDLLSLFQIDVDNILALINGRPVDLDARFNDGDRVVLMEPNGNGNPE